MKFFHKLSWLFLAAALLAASSASAAIVPNSVKAVTVTGNVTSILNGQSQRVDQGAMLSEGATVRTGARSQVGLLFSNGSAVVLRENSSLTITEFSQQPFNTRVNNPEELKDDPSVSTTELKLDQGSVVGQVNNLRQGSSFHIRTDVGVAGIRGTTFGVTVIGQADGSVVMQVFNVQGIVEVVQFDSPVGLTLGANQEVRISVENGQAVVSPPSDLPQSTVDAIINVVRTLPPTIVSDVVPADPVGPVNPEGPRQLLVQVQAALASNDTFEVDTDVVSNDGDGDGL